MNTQDQRLEAAKLARELDAPQTLAVINNTGKDSSISEILQSADKEVGRTKLIQTILDSPYPQWAIGALRNLADLGSDREKLVAKARLIVAPSEAKAAQASRDSRSTDLNVPSVSTMRMYIACGASYTASFSLWHYTPPFDNTWIKGTKTGDTKPVCQSDTRSISYFSTPQQPINPGDVVQMFVHVNGGIDKPTGYLFIYDPNSNAIAEIDCHGGTLSADFSYTVSGS